MKKDREEQERELYSRERKCSEYIICRGKRERVCMKKEGEEKIWMM